MSNKAEPIVQMLMVSLQQLNCFWLLQFKTDSDKETFRSFFQEVQQIVDSKQLRPMIRTQYNRTAFQVSPTKSLKMNPKDHCTALFFQVF